QDLLTLARRGRYEMKPTNINAVIEEYLDSPSFLGLTGRNPKVILQSNLDDRISPINGSASHLSKVVMNLIINAFDAMPNGGSLIIETSQKYLKHLSGDYEGFVEGDYILLRIKDTGVGISQEDLTKIFEPFYSKKQMGTSGSGLGLSIVYGIVKDHKGFHDTISEIGAGTEFILYFPSLQANVSIIAEEQIDYSGHETILVVDDIEEQREIASQIISSLGYSVEKVSNGREAVKFLTDRSVDLVILDMIMEKDFDGLDTYQAIVKIHSNQRVIIVSGFWVTDRVSRMQVLGAGQYVRKPYNRDTIGKAIREELDKGRLITVS
ncbi:MAG: response regulator, partial [candidate division Zixibacteria bacterium]|nr:response regulator [candidate division Zixibacteria bacterium]